jgi:hypothetical protein
MLIDNLLQKEHIAERQRILGDRLLECLVAYEKELISSPLSGKEKRRLFYEKYRAYGNQLSKPQRLAQRIIVWAGECRLFYPLVYLFKLYLFRNN